MRASGRSSPRRRFFTLLFGAISLLNHWAPAWAILPGFALVVYMFIGWFGNVIGENHQGIYGLDVDRSFRMGMMWFIFSEVMFFAAFFGALFYARSLSVPWLGGEGTKVIGNELLHPARSKTPGRPTAPRGSGRATTATFEIIPAFGLPAVNTIILLSSGVTVTIAHHALRAGKRGVLNIFLAATFLLGFLFVYLQATEYAEAYQHLGLQLGDRHLRLDVLHAHGLPRIPRDARRHHAGVHLVADDERPFHAGAAFRVRGGGVVLALRGRGVVRPVHIRLLDLIEARTAQLQVEVSHQRRASRRAVVYAP